MGHGPVTSPPEVADLAERIRCGDRSAENALVAEFGERVLIMLQARLHDPDAAQELAQDVLLSVLEALRNGRLKHGEKLPAFVHGTARNVANSYVRERIIRRQHVDRHPENAIPNPAEYFEQAERRALVRRALEQVDPAARQILFMTLVDGLTPAAIAGRLGLKAETVRQRKCRALKRITKAVKKLSREPGYRHRGLER